MDVNRNPLGAIRTNFVVFRGGLPVSENRIIISDFGRGITGGIG
jgi:hypothetical protein